MKTALLLLALALPTNAEPQTIQGAWIAQVKVWNDAAHR